MKTKLDLITGFLGSGKTTFINGYLEYLSKSGERVAIIENEFGRPGFDTALLKSTNYDVSELSGGCICCGQKVKFHDLIVELSEYNDRIVIEPSGIYTVEDFFDVYNSPLVLEKVEIGSILAILDMAQTKNLNNSSKAIMMSQLSMAGSIIVSKVGNVSDEEIVEKEAREFLNGLLTANNIPVGNIEDRLSIKPWSMLTEMDYERFVESGYFETNANIPKEDHQYVYQTFAINPSFSRDQEVREFLDHLFNAESGNVLRVKGFTKVQDKTYVINATPKDYGYSLFTGDEEEIYSELTVIGNELRRKVINSFFDK